MTTAELAGKLRWAIFNAYRATMVGQPALITARYWDRASNPRVGDLVAEITGIHRYHGSDSAGHLKGVGVLEAIEQERVDLGQGVEWDEQTEGRPHPTERVFYIRSLEGKLVRWTNAQFAAALTEDDAAALTAPPPVTPVLKRNQEREA